jgi:hypothetical protein
MAVRARSMTKKPNPPLTVLQLRDILNKVLTDHGDLPVAVTLLVHRSAQTGAIDRVNIVETPGIQGGATVLNLTTLGKEPKSWS